MKLALIGVGAGGTAVVDAFVERDRRTGAGAVHRVLAVDTTAADLEALSYIPEGGRVLVGGDRVHGEGTGGDVELGAELLADESDRIEGAVRSIPVGDIDAFLVVAGLGGGTGGGCAPVLAKYVARNDAVPVFGLAILPADDEGESAVRNAALSLRPFFDHTDGLVVFDADAADVATREEYPERIVERLSPLLAVDDDTEGLSPAAVTQTLRAGISTVGYADREIQREDDSSGGVFSRFTGGDDDGEEDLARVTELVREAALGDLTLPAECSTAERVLLLATGPEDRIPRRGVEESREWLEDQVAPGRIRTGTDHVDEDRIRMVTLFSGVTDADRVSRLNRIAQQAREEMEEDDEPEEAPTVVVDADAVHGARLNQGARMGVAVMNGTLTGNVADRTVGPLVDHGGQALVVGGDVSERAKRTLAENGVAAISVDPDAVGNVAAALSARPVIDGAHLAGDDVGLVDGIEHGDLREDLALAVRDTAGEIATTARREDTDTSTSSGAAVADGDGGGGGGGGGTAGSAGASASASPAGGATRADESDRAGDESAQAGGTYSGPSPPVTIPTPPSVDLSGGDVELRQAIGEGPNADVRLATTPDGDKIALKFPEFADDVDRHTAKRVFGAVEEWAGIDAHGNVAGVIDHGLKPRPWIAVEYMDGGSLRDRMESLSFEEAAWVASQVGAAMEHAHGDDVVHLAVRPENVMFRETGPEYLDAPKVTDWGLSHHLHEQSGSLEGFPTEYSAPEQLEDSLPTGPHTDVYQLGLLCYELFTGELPFEGLATGVIDKVFNEEPDPPTERNPELPPAVDDVVLTALGKRKQDRQDHVALVRQSLQELTPIG